MSSDSGPVLEALKTKIKHYANGKLTHAEDVLPVLYELMESDESIEETPLPAAASSNQPVIGGDWDGLKKVLTSSLTSGTFLDSQFYAVESRLSAGPPKIRPIYLCSMVGGSFISSLLGCGSFTRIGCLETFLTKHSRFLKTRGTGEAASSMCRRVR